MRENMRSLLATLQATDNATTEVAVEYGNVDVSTDHHDHAPEDGASYTPAQARSLAAALLRAADEAEGREPRPAERDLLAFIDRTGYDGATMVAALVNEIRREGK